MAETGEKTDIAFRNLESRSKSSVMKRMIFVSYIYVYTIYLLLINRKGHCIFFTVVMSSGLNVDQSLLLYGNLECKTQDYL